MVTRSQQAALRSSQRRKSFASRRFAPSLSRGVVPRSRLFQRQVQQEEKVRQEDKQQINNIISDINDGKISNLAQIPSKYRNLIGVTQTEINNIQNFFRAKRDADLWVSAFKLADRVLDSKNGLAVLAIKFSSNPYAKSAFKIAAQNRKAAKQRQQVLQDIRLGKIIDVAIINGRIMDTSTGRAITPTQVTNKQFLSAVQNQLPLGEKLIFNPKTFNITGIQSNLLGKSFAYTKGAIASYTKLINNIPNIKQMASDIAGGRQSLIPNVIKNANINIFSLKTWGDFIKSIPQSKAVSKIDASVVRNVNKLFDGGMKLGFNPFQKEINKFLSDFYSRAGSQAKRGALNIRGVLNGVKESQFGKLQPLFNKDKEQMAAISQFIRKNPGLPDRVLIDSMKANGIFENRKDVIKTLFHLSQYIGATIVTTLIDLGLATPGIIRAFKRSPLITLLALPPAIIEGFKQDYGRVRSGDPFQLADLLIEYYTIGKVFKVVGSLSRPLTSKLANLVPGTKRTINGNIILRKAPAETFKVRGNTRLLAKRVQKPSFKRPFSSVADFLKGRKPGQFKKFTKDPGLVLRESTVKTAGQPLSRQAQLAGQEVTAVNAAADQITSWIRRKKIVRKPIPGENLAPTRIKNLIKKFDNGTKLNIREFTEVNTWLQKNSAPNITLLERSLYLDPKSGLRLSRLGIQPVTDASLIDLLRGNFKFRSAKPQILIFENAKVAKFPKALADVKKVLLRDGKLTTSQTNRLIKWQVQNGSGRFKPIGSTIYQGGIELEVTLAPGEFIKRIKRVGTLVHQGKRVSIVTAKIFKPGKSLLKQIKLANLGKLGKKALAKLEKIMSKKLGRKIQIETPTNLKSLARQGLREARRLNPNIPVLRVRGSFLRVLKPSQIRRRNAAIKSTRRSTVRKKVTKRRTPTKRTPRRKKVKRTPKRRPKVKRRKASRPKRKPRRTPRTKRPVKRARPRPKRTPRPTPRKQPRPKPRPRTGRPGKKVKKPLPRLGSKFGKRNLKKKQPGFFIVVRRKGKKIKLNQNPLVMKDARDFLAWKIDKGLSRTAWFEPMGKKKRVVRLPKAIKGYFLRNRKKLRPFKIRSGKKKALRRGYIEKRKYISDTKSEKRLLAKSRKNKTPKRRRVRRKKK